MSINKINILYYCNEFPPFPSGGIGVFTKELAEALVNTNNAKNVVVYGQYFNISKIKIQNINGVIVIRDKKRRGVIGLIYNRIRGYFVIKRIVEKYNIDILEVQDFLGLTAFYPKFTCKTLIRLHGSVSYFNSLLSIRSFKGGVWYILEYLHLRRADHVVSVSKFTANKTMELFHLKKDIPVIYNGINISSLKSHTPSKLLNERKSKRYIFAGSIIKKKGINELISAWISFSKKHPVAQLDIYGKDIEGLVEKIKFRLAEANISSVNFKGVVSKNYLMNVYQYYTYAVFPTKAEAFSLAVLEAMYSGKVVLYTNQTSSEEIIIDNENGLLIKSTNPNEIESTLIKSYKLSDDDCSRISKAAQRTIINSFSTEGLISDNIKLYKNLSR